MERKLFTALQGQNAQRLNDSLCQQGFRRSQNVLYRPSCADCSACLSARINVARFKPRKSQKRAMNRNAGLERKATSPWATEEQYELFRSYLDSRHANGGMADMDVFEFAAMIEETPIRSRVDRIQRHRDRRSGCRQPDGRARRRPVDGLFLLRSRPAFRQPRAPIMILDHIDIAREAKLPYVYLGYWVPGSKKMSYKSRFSGLEIYLGGRWQSLEDPDGFRIDKHPLANDPIAEQVANIQLPDTIPVSR